MGGRLTEDCLKAQPNRGNIVDHPVQRASVDIYRLLRRPCVQRSKKATEILRVRIAEKFRCPGVGGQDRSVALGRRRLGLALGERNAGHNLIEHVENILGCRCGGRSLTDINVRVIFRWDVVLWFGKLPIDCPFDSVQLLPNTECADFRIGAGSWGQLVGQRFEKLTELLVSITSAVLYLTPQLFEYLAGTSDRRVPHDPTGALDCVSFTDHLPRNMIG